MENKGTVNLSGLCSHRGRNRELRRMMTDAEGSLQESQDGRKLVSLKAILLTNPEEKFHFKKNGLEKQKQYIPEGEKVRVREIQIQYTDITWK